ncbi:SnoaL-like domain protein [Caballeronia peredens]|nr:SnoaL-like domain protein [Caballeronia peredens]
MNKNASPEALIQKQLDAYNARDLDAWLATYAPDAKQFEFPATLRADGIREICARSAVRFQEPNLHAQLLHRTVIGDIVIDHERVTRTFPEGPGTLEMLATYRVVGGAIQEASFVFGPKQLDEPSSR